jgi:hypothetical protein
MKSPIACSSTVPGTFWGGEIFEDMIFATLTHEENTACPECDGPVAVSEESLRQIVMSRLSQM